MDPGITHNPGRGLPRGKLLHAGGAVPLLQVILRQPLFAFPADHATAAGGAVPLLQLCHKVRFLALRAEDHRMERTAECVSIPRVKQRSAVVALLIVHVRSPYPSPFRGVSPCAPPHWRARCDRGGCAMPPPIRIYIIGYFSTLSIL